MVQIMYRFPEAAIHWETKLITENAVLKLQFKLSKY